VWKPDLAAAIFPIYFNNKLTPLQVGPSGRCPAGPPFNPALLHC
jgi:hypothetical protein